MDENKDKRIVLTNDDIYSFVNPTSPFKTALDKIQRLCTVSGKTQYWIFRFMKKFQETISDLESTRMELVKKYADKDGNNNPKISLVTKGEHKFQFNKNNGEAFQKQMNELLQQENVFQINRIVINIELLDLMNKGVPKEMALNSSDMVLLEKIFEFVE